MGKLCPLPLVLLYLAGCHSHPHHTHDDDHGAADHAHHEEAEVEPVQISLWNAEVELFIEHPPFVAGEPTRFVTHVTHLENWAPRTEGPIQLILSADGEPSIEIVDEVPARDGIYIPTLTFPKAGVWEIEVRVPLANGTSSTKIRDVRVLSSRPGPSEPEGEDGSISFLKEQQWKMLFSSQAVEEAVFRESLAATGVIAPHAGGEVVIHAPAAGRFETSAEALPYLGREVDRDQRLGSLIPRLGQAEDLAMLRLAVDKAELAHAHAEKERTRIEGLFQKEAIPESRLANAELQVRSTRAELETAGKRLQQYSAVQKGGAGASAGRINLYAPISGTITETEAVSGALVAEGDRLFQIIDMSKIWLTANIPEGDIGKIRDARGAWFRVDGLDRVFKIDPPSAGRLVAMGGKIDPVRRTVPLIFEMPNPNDLLKIGMFARVFVMTGNAETGPSIPHSAIVEESGQSIAYVQTGGESFERRILQLGIREGDRVLVKAGVALGERVVTQGAYQVRLAASSTEAPAHGHAH